MVAPPACSPAPPLLSSKARRTAEQPISYLITVAMQNPHVINLAAGLVDPQTLPIDAVGEIARRIFTDATRARAALQYDTTIGLAPLRQAAISHLQKLESESHTAIAAQPADVIITTGSQQALYIIGDVLLDPGDIVIAANPCYFVFTGTLKSLGARVLTVPMTENGMDVDAVEPLLQRLSKQGLLERVKLIYTTSYFQNPTGLTLSLNHRQKLVELARRFSQRHRIFILEDAAYRELRYDGDALPSMKSMDPGNEYTILAQTFSKPFAPGIKTGYAVMPADLALAVLHQKGNHDFGSASLAQHIALEALNAGLFDQQVEILRDNYRRKRDAMLNALKRYMPADGSVHWTQPAGGLYVWLTLPPQVDTSRDSAFFANCLGDGVLYVPGDYCFQPDEHGQVPRNHLRLSFGQVRIDQIDPGIARLAKALGQTLAASRSNPSGAATISTSGA